MFKIIMENIPSVIENVKQLEELISRPSVEIIELMTRTEGDLMFLGIAGKIGPSLATMAKRACELAGVKKRFYGASRFSSEETRKYLENNGIETISGDLMDADFLKKLPKVRNVFFLAGMKFGSEDNLALTWAINAYLPAMVAETFKNSKIVAYSTGCVYPLVTVDSGGSKEVDQPKPVGEYAQSCLGRERMFEYGSSKYNTPVSIIRLNYSVEMRYGVLTDIATKVWQKKPVDLSMGYFNIIWQGDANEMVLRSLDVAASPAKIINVTGAEILNVREIATEFGKHFGLKPEFVGTESKTALLNDAGLAFDLFGKPKVPVEKMIEWTANWIRTGNRLFNKPTHFETRDGKY